MIKWIKAKLAAARRWRDAEDFWRGYDRTAGTLLSGDASVAGVIGTIATMNFTSYDRGVLTACKAFNRLQARPT